MAAYVCGGSDGEILAVVIWAIDGLLLEDAFVQGPPVIRQFEARLLSCAMASTNPGHG